MITVLRGPCSIYSGYGNLFRNLAERLGKRFSVELLPLDNRITDGFPLPITKVARGKQFGILVGPGDKITQLPTRYRILYTMYEASDIPRSWKIDMNVPDEVWVPTKFCQDVFSSYNRRVRIVPAGYDERAYHHCDWTTEERNDFWRIWCPEAIGKHVLGTAGVMSDRKGVDILLKAWELAGIGDAVLVIKTRDTRTLLSELPENVHVIDENWPEERMADFYRSLDLFVLSTRGEGFGICPLESVACGTPALVTRASGPADYIDDRGIYGLEVIGTSPAKNIQAEKAEWYEPDGNDLVSKLREWLPAPPPIEHQYRQWSMECVADVWEAEIHQAQKRAAKALTG